MAFGYKTGLTDVYCMIHEGRLVWCLTRYIEELICFCSPFLRLIESSRVSWILHPNGE